MKSDYSVRIFDFSHYHGKGVQGSTFIRVNQVMKYWPEAGLYKYGENPDVLIFQKIYMTPDYQFPKHFKGIKILDICDPDWLDGVMIKATLDVVDAITCPTEALAKFLRQLTDKPIKVIADRWDLEIVPEPKKHTRKAETVLWYGYSHNAETLRPAIPLLKQLGLKLLIISNDDPLFNRYLDDYEFVKLTDQNTKEFYEIAQRADFAILPKGSRPQDIYKSNNKDTKANLAGLPVAKSIEDTELYMSAKARQDYIDKYYDIIKSDYDVRKSVEDYKELIHAISQAK